MDKDKKKSRPDELRQSAEIKAASQREISHINIESLSIEQLEAIFHDLKVHQIELEMQNDELRRTQESLDAARARYFDLYDLAPVGYITISRDGIITESNLTCTSLLGVDRSSFNNNYLSKFIFKDDQDIYYLHRKKLFETGISQTCELRMISHDRTIWVKLDGSLASEEKDEQVCRLVMSDITEKKHQESEREKLKDSLHQLQKLESIGILAGGIAHDFNNLLTGVFGFIELAMAKNTDEKIAGYLKNSINSIDRAKSLTRQLLTFSKGGTPIKTVEDMFSIIRNTIDCALRGTSIYVKYNMQENLWPCNVDRNQICQVIDNIIINARQAMAEGGTIEISAQNTRMNGEKYSALNPGNYVKLSIKDQGSGICTENLPFIFDPFYSTKSAGNGLGLSTCYSIIHQHGGAIEVESESGNGSTFHIYLPASNKMV